MKDIKGKPLSYWLELLDHNDPGARAEATDVLPKINEAIILELRELVDGLDDELRDIAIDGLSSIALGYVRTYGILAELMFHPLLAVRQKAVAALEFYDANLDWVLPQILAGLATANTEVRQGAGRVLHTIYVERDILLMRELRTALIRGSRSERIGSIRGLVFIEAETEWRLDLLKDALEDRDSDVRDEATQAMQIVQQQPAYDE